MIFSNVSVIDRSLSPSHGSRAIHVIVSHNEKLVEIQVRTSLQHVWAELSEKMSDVLDPAIKYGGGQESFRKLLSTWSGVIDTEERVERILDETKRRVNDLLSQATRSSQEQAELVQQQMNIERQVKEQASRRAANLRSMRKAIDSFAKLKLDGDSNAVSD